MASARCVVGLIGAGTVGGGVVEILNREREKFLRLGVDFVVSKICVRDPSKARDFCIPTTTTIVTSVDDILSDPEIQLVVEVMGGTSLAKDVIFRAITQGKHVVTANKAVIAQELANLSQLLQENPNVKFGYEAAVCGGIPIIRSLQESLVGDSVYSITGIMNGTTNFILSTMAEKGSTYESVLSEAQKLGYAEADPTADVEGFDARSKLTILCRLAFGVNLDESSMFTQGISSITSHDNEYAKLLKSTVKLLGRAWIDSERNVVTSFISPVVVPNTSVIAQVGGPTNVIEVESASLGKASFVGAGAGRYPTSNSVVSDMLAIGRGQKLGNFLLSNDSLTFEHDFVSRFYVRIRARDQVGIIRRVGEACEIQSVSIYAVLQTPIVDPTDVHFVVTTESASLSRVLAACQTISEQDFCIERPFVMPILSG